ncbi:MAG: hypothetical protein AB7G88_07565 [Thermomicrobiales bacterium]
MTERAFDDLTRQVAQSISRHRLLRNWMGDGVVIDGSTRGVSEAGLTTIEDFCLYNG